MKGSPIKRKGESGRTTTGAAPPETAQKQDPDPNKTPSPKKSRAEDQDRISPLQQVRDICQNAARRNQSNVFNPTPGQRVEGIRTWVGGGQVYEEWTSAEVVKVHKSTNEDVEDSYTLKWEGIDTSDPYSEGHDIPHSKLRPMDSGNGGAGSGQPEPARKLHLN